MVSAMILSRLLLPFARRLIALTFVLAASFTCFSQSGSQTGRPAITGISHMCVYAADPAASETFYTHILGAVMAPDPFAPNGTRYLFSASQFVEVLPLPADHTISRLNCVAFTTTDAKALHAYMQAHNAESVGNVEAAQDGALWFTSYDPEGNLVEFVQPGHPHAVPATAKPIGTRIIHVGYMVKSKAAEDKFYRDILGFRPYWFGAMKPDKVDWVSLQVPDGKDWIEYMLVGDGSTSPLDSLNAQHLGVLNHFSIGVPNMEKAVTTLYAEGRLSPRHDGPQMGLDGKWQANWYDPDGTRVELMEFQPVMKPCCSDFTATSPTE